MQIKLTLLAAGSCAIIERMMLRGAGQHKVAVPALFALLEHPTLGPILYDTGYAPRFLAETARFPASLYARLTPVTVAESDSALSQLRAKGIKPQDLRTIILSHFHADHLGGLLDFPHAQFIYFQEAYEAVHGLQGWSALRAAYLPGLLPPDFATRSKPVDHTETIPLPPAYFPFSHGVDLLGDGSLLAVPLPGHAIGQMGLFLQTEPSPVLLAADACWHSQAYRDLIWPHPLANLIQADLHAYRRTLTKLHQLHHNNPEVSIIPSHCGEVYEQYVVKDQ